MDTEEVVVVIVVDVGVVVVAAVVWLGLVGLVWVGRGLQRQRQGRSRVGREKWKKGTLGLEKAGQPRAAKRVSCGRKWKWETTRVEPNRQLS